MAHNPSSIPDPDDGFPMPLGSDGAEAGASAVAALVPSHLLALARRIATAREVRDRVFDPALSINPPWNILLELFIAGEEGRSVTIKSACVASGVPQSTALRYIAHLIDVGLCLRNQHPSDARSAHLKLTSAAHRKMIEYLRQISEPHDPPAR